jgi:hypothetical protein
MPVIRDIPEALAVVASEHVEQDLDFIAFVANCLKDPGHAVWERLDSERISVNGREFRAPQPPAAAAAAAAPQPPAAAAAAAAPQPPVAAAAAAAVVGGVAGSAVAAPVVVTTVQAIGFSASGVLAGSLAALIQSPVTAAGSLFAICQSIGATGAVGVAVPVVGAVVGAVAVGGMTYALLSGKKK